MSRPAWTTVLGRIPKRYLLACAAVVCMGIALAMRLPGYDGRPLWIDELWRINMMLDPSFFEHYFQRPDVYSAITAPIYALFSNFVGAFNRLPETLRLVSLLPGLGAVLLAFVLVWRFGGGWVGAVAIALVFALNIQFIRYSNELKPYVFEVLVHLAVVFVVLEAVRADRVTATRWLLLLLTLVLALFSGANTVSLQPATGTTLFVHYLLVRRRRELLTTVAIMGVVAVVSLLLYVLVWSYGSEQDLLNYWSMGFHKEQGWSYVPFLIERFQAMWEGAFNIVGPPAHLKGSLLFGESGVKLSDIAFFVLCAAAVLHLSSGRRCAQSLASRIAIFYALFFATIASLNLLMLWPLGNLRPNLFIFAHLILLTFLLVATLPNPIFRLLLSGPLLIYLLASLSQVTRAQLVQCSPPTEQHDIVWQAFLADGGAGRRIAQRCQDGKSTVFFDPGMSHAITYYRNIDRVNGAVNSGLLGDCAELQPMPVASGHVAAARARLEQEAPRDRPFWLTYSHQDQWEVAILIKLAKEFGRIGEHRLLNGSGYIEVIPTRVTDTVDSAPESSPNQ